MTPEQAEQARVRASEDKARKRIDDERKARQAERDEHDRTMAAEAEKSRSELDKVLDELKEPQRWAVRLEAYKVVLSGEYDPGHLQARVDDMALRLARYMLSGKV